MGLQKMIGMTLVVLFLLSTGIIFAQEMPEGFQELYEEYMAISQQLQATHQAVMQDPEIIEKSEQFSEYIDQKLIALSPEVAEVVRERNSIISELEDARDKEDRSKEVELQPRFQQLNQELQPYIESVLDDSEVQDRQEQLDALFMAKMNEIDPETDQKIERLEIITEQLQKMME
ncbi:MAG: hypothetical protein K0B81_09315 [Candidatus Cloacimonetes bacterium]|nr:hypothetical protein [Candidatus Cloacimonadota bacterium]